MTTETIRATAETIATILAGLTADGPQVWDYGHGGMIAKIDTRASQSAMMAISDALAAQGGTEWMPAADPAAMEIRALLRSQELTMLSHCTATARDLAALHARAARLRAAV